MNQCSAQKELQRGYHKGTFWANTRPICVDFVAVSLELMDWIPLRSCVSNIGRKHMVTMWKKRRPSPFLSSVFHKP